jgi:phospholipid/cholesterol/gamma-HCH transport system substrate-binding protein
MERKGIGIEVRVGIFVFIGLVVLGYMALRVNKTKFKTVEGYTLTVFFDSVSGLVKNSPIQIAGIEVGRVKDIVLKDGRAQVTMTILNGVPIYADAQAIIKSQGVLGDKFIEIAPGKASAQLLKGGGLISQSRSTVELDDILAKAAPAMEDISKVTKNIGDILGTEEGKNNLKETFFNIKKTTEDIRNIATGLSEGEGTMGKLIRDDALYKDMRTTVTGLKDTVTQIQEGRGSIGKFIKDEEFYDQTKRTMGSLEKVANKIDSGEGTLGKLVNDDSLYKETKYTLRSVTKATEGLSEQVPVSILGTILGTVLK